MDFFFKNDKNRGVRKLNHLTVILFRWILWNGIFHFYNKERQRLILFSRAPRTMASFAQLSSMTVKSVQPVQESSTQFIYRTKSKWAKKTISNYHCQSTITRNLFLKATNIRYGFVEAILTLQNNLFSTARH